MNRTEIEQAVLKEIHTLPLDKVEATLNNEVILIVEQKTGLNHANNCRT